jgi:hypothetical protein
VILLFRCDHILIKWGRKYFLLIRVLKFFVYSVTQRSLILVKLETIQFCILVCMYVFYSVFIRIVHANTVFTACSCRDSVCLQLPVHSDLTYILLEVLELRVLKSCQLDTKQLYVFCIRLLCDVFLTVV